MKQPASLRRQKQPQNLATFDCTLSGNCSHDNDPSPHFERTLIAAFHASTPLRLPALFCRTSKMSHDRSWRELCSSFDHSLEKAISTARDRSGRWLWRLVGPFSHGVA